MKLQLAIHSLYVIAAKFCHVSRQAELQANQHLRCKAVCQALQETSGPSCLGLETLLDDIIWNCCDGLGLDILKSEALSWTSYFPLGLGYLLCKRAEIKQ